MVFIKLRVEANVGVKRSPQIFLKWVRSREESKIFFKYKLKVPKICNIFKKLCRETQFEKLLYYAESPEQIFRQMNERTFVIYNKRQRHLKQQKSQPNENSQVWAFIFLQKYIKFVSDKISRLKIKGARQLMIHSRPCTLPSFHCVGLFFFPSFKYSELSVDFN